MFKRCLLIIAALVLSPQAVKGQIMGGTPALPGEIRYYAYLRQADVEFCGGTLISSKHVLTAGHCVVDSKKCNGQRTAIVGTNNPEHGGSSYLIVGDKVEPRYKRKIHMVHDIGIFILQRDVWFSTLVSTANLPESAQIQYGATATIAGTGKVTHHGPFSEVLQKLNVKGDSGSGLVQDNVIIGVAVGGYSPPKPEGQPDIFNYVFLHISWINRIIEAPSKVHPRR